MGFKTLLNEAIEHFSDNEMQEKISLIFKYGWGFEHWFQNELLVAFHRKGHKVDIRGKMKKDADIIVDGLGLELKCWKRKYPSKRNLINAFDQHPNADSYLFLTEVEPAMIKELKDFASRGHVFRIKPFGEMYALIMIEKKHRTQ